MNSLFYLTLIWGGVFIASWIAEKSKLTSVLYFLALGAIFVNVGIMPEDMPPFLTDFSQLGIIVIMFALGFEENTSDFIKSVKKSWGIAVFGAIVPFLTTYLLALMFWASQRMALMCGLAMAATTVSLSMVSLKNAKLQHSAAARGIMASAVLDNIASLILLAIVIPMVTEGPEVNIQNILFILAKVILFFSVVSLLGSCIFPKNVNSKFLPVLAKYGIKDIVSFKQGEKTTLVILFVAVATALFGHWLGFHAAIGAYMAGLILKEEYFRLDEKNVNYKRAKHVIDDVAYTWIGPVFFVVLGSHLIFDKTIFFAVIIDTIVLVIGLMASQIISASLAARYTGGYDWRSSLLIGFGMLGRAELAFVVMDIGYVQYQILSKEIFYTLMFTAFWLNVSVPLAIGLWRRYIAPVELAAK